VWRPAPGAAPVVMDAYCAHNGAHLAHGGAATVRGPDGAACLRCPFHGWCYDEKGRVVAVPGEDALPKGADMRVWPSRERNGVVSVWMSAAGHGAAGPAADAPTFETPVFADIDGPAPPFAFHGFSEHVVPALIYELPENGADIAHLTELHADFVVPALRGVFSHTWTGTWAPRGGDAPHLADLRVVQRTAAFGVALPGAVRVAVTQAGISQVYLQFELPGLGRALIVETVTPVAPARLRVLHAVHAERRVPRAAAKALLWSVCAAYEQDLPVWAHKRYEAAPRWTRKEASIGEYRRWARQFYRDPAAITFADAKRAEAELEGGGALEW